MAEVLGAVASGLGVAAFAIQIAESVTKIRNFIENVKDAPEEIRNNIQHIEIMGKLLADIEKSYVDDGLSDIQSSSAAECLGLCRNSVRVLEEIIQNLESALVIRRRFGVGKVQVALKKGVIERLAKRLDAANLLLMLSHQTYLGAVQRRRHELQIQIATENQQRLVEVKIAMAQTTAASSQSSHLHIGSMEAEVAEENTCQEISRPSSFEGSPSAQNQWQRSEGCYRRDNKIVKHHAKLLARFKAPYWLPVSRRVWEFYSQRAYSGWTTTFRQYNIVDEEAPVMSFAATNNVNGLQELFSSGKATPCDVGYDGHRVLDIAIWLGHIATCRFLLENGADPNHTSYSKYSGGLLRIALICPSYTARARKENAANEIFRCIADKTYQGLFDHKNLLYDIGTVWISPSTLKWYLENSGFNFTARDLSQRIDMAHDIVHSYQAPNTAPLIRCLIQHSELELVDKNRAMSLLGLFLYDFCQKEMQMKFLASGKYIPKGNFIRWQICTITERDDLLTLIIDTLPQMGFRHRLCICTTFRAWDGRQPLANIFSGWCRIVEELDPRHKNEYYQELISVVHAWLNMLLECGVDLVQYGYKEQFCYLHHGGRRAFNIGHQTSRMMRLIGFVYGPRPTDWYLWITEDFPNYLRLFWEMVEHPEWAMPGAWTDYYDDRWIYDEDDEYDIRWHYTRSESETEESEEDEE